MTRRSHDNELFGEIDTEYYLEPGKKLNAEVLDSRLVSEASSKTLVSNIVFKSQNKERSASKIQKKNTKVVSTNLTSSISLNVSHPNQQHSRLFDLFAGFFRQMTLFKILPVIWALMGQKIKNVFLQ